MELKIKGQFHKNKVAFAKTGSSVLGDKTQEELTQLAIIGRKSGDKAILDLFEGELPTLQELQGGKVKAAISNLKPPNS